MVPKRSASCMVACSRSDPVRSASPRLAPVRSADLRCAPRRSARYRMARFNLARLRCAPRRSASVRSADSKSAPWRSASLRWTMRSPALRRFAPLRSGWISGTDSLHLFHTSEPCCNNPTCAWSAIHVQLSLRRATASHNGPHIDDLVTSGYVVTVKGVSAHVQVGAVDLHPLAELHIFVRVGPSESAVFCALCAYLQPRHPLYLVGGPGNRLVPVVCRD